MIGFDRRYSGIKLVSWLQRRCICGKFLSRFQHKFCSVCSDKIRKLQEENYHKEHKVFGSHSKDYREYNNLRSYVFNHADRLNVGDII